MLNTSRGYRIADLRYSSGELERRLLPIAPPPSPASMANSSPQPEFQVDLDLARTLHVTNLYLPFANMTADSYDPETSAEDASECVDQPEPGTVSDFTGPGTSTADQTSSRSTVIQSTSSLLNPEERSRRGRRSVSASRLPPRRQPRDSSSTPQITARDAFQGSLLCAFDPELSPDDQLHGDSQLISLVPGQSSSSSPLLKKVTVRQRPLVDQIWQAARTADMPTAGPVCLPDACQLPDVPVTGAKRQRSHSESLLTGELASALKSCETDSPRQSLLQSLSRAGQPSLPFYLPSPNLLEPPTSDTSSPSPLLPISNNVPTSPRRSSRLSARPRKWSK